ncbi:TonB-dependent receptor [Sphingobium amiense]|uniref:TonB-dependent receptor n=1 Tax=Sphingobium amiense TaxID=135719 RepID=A0A494W8R3_9SPHN|nr:TonB-dependent receptor [Sphingobium amiense]BBD98967.1 TonB-dependent receptor [Sphingobium amiense]
MISTRQRPMRRALILCLLASAATPVAAFAQAPAEAEAEAIVVTGTRPIAESEAAALEIQKNSDSLVTVAASDSVGRLPDQNIAQAASRLPGISVERDQGQARYINLRGAPKTWTTLSFDGINVVSPEGRDARFDSIPSAIAGKIIVSKAVTPDMPGETVAGNVNVVTRSAFDYAGFHIAGKGGLGFAELGDRKEYEGNLVLSNRFDTGIGEIGVLLSGSYYERNMVTDNFENDYERVSRDARPGNATRFWVHETENKLYRLTRKNWSVSGRVDWKPDDRTTISARSIYTIFTDDEARDNYRFDLDDRENDLVANTAACGASTANTTSGYADICAGNTPQKGTIYGIDIRQRSTLRAYKQSVFTNTLEGSHELADGWKLSWTGNYTESKDDRSVVGEVSWESPSARNLRPTVAYDFTDPNFSRLTLFRTIQTGTGAATRYTAGDQVTAVDSFAKTPTGFTVLDAVDTTKAYTGRVVLARELDNATLKAGFQYDRRNKIADENQISLNAAQAATILPQDYAQFSLDQKFLGEIPMGYTFRYFDQDKMRAASAAARKAFSFTPNTGNNYNVREEVFAGYLVGTFRYDWGTVVGGVRVEHIKNEGRAIGTVGTASQLIVAKADQTLAFPSMHINYNLDDTKKLRLSFNSGAARADYDQLRPNVVINDTNETISGGNPAVRPERAYGVDAYFEWYVRPQGYLMVGAFYKKIEDVLYTARRIYNSPALNSNNIDRSGYQFSGIVNGGTGRLFGMEAAAQLQLEPWTQDLGLPDFLGGFGVSANVTLNDSKVDIDGRRMRLPGTSDFVYNIGGYYEKYGLSVRLQYQNRSKWLDTVGTLTDGGDTYWASDDELDFSARYAVTKNFEIYFDASNLLNNPGRRFSDPGSLLRASGVAAADTSNQTIEWERFGRRYTGGIRFNF